MKISIKVKQTSHYWQYKRGKKPSDNKQGGKKTFQNWNIAGTQNKNRTQGVKKTKIKEKFQAEGDRERTAIAIVLPMDLYSSRCTTRGERLQAISSVLTASTSFILLLLPT